MAGSATASSGKSSSLRCGVKSGSAASVAVEPVRRAGWAPITSSRRAAHNAARRSSPNERNASASASRSMVKRETPAMAAIRSIEEKPLPRAAMSFFISSSLSPWIRRKPRRTACLPSPRGAGLQRAIPIAAIDIGGADFDAVLACIAGELRRLIKAHRLAVDDGGAEHLRVAAFDPCRGIDQKRKARRVAFGKTVFAEALDLAETVFREIAIIAARRHAVDELVAEQMDRAVMTEGGHGAAEPIGFVGRKFRRGDGDLHRLLLEQRHAEGAFENLFQFVWRSVCRIGRGIMLLLDAVAPAQIRMHHVALDRPRPHDRNFDDEIVEALRLQARQHRHLRPALDLEHADRVGARQHLVDRSVVLRQRGERIGLAVMLLQEIKPAAQAAQHAKREHIDLHEPERVDIVLVPFDEGAIVHGGIADRHRLVERRAGEHEAADMLRQMAREADQFVGEINRLPDRRI